MYFLYAWDMACISAGLALRGNTKLHKVVGIGWLCLPAVLSCGMSATRQAYLFCKSFVYQLFVLAWFIDHPDDIPLRIQMLQQEYRSGTDSERDH